MWNSPRRTDVPDALTLARAYYDHIRQSGTGCRLHLRAARRPRKCEQYMTALAITPRPIIATWWAMRRCNLPERLCGDLPAQNPIFVNLPRPLKVAVDISDTAFGQGVNLAFTTAARLLPPAPYSGGWPYGDEVSAGYSQPERQRLRACWR
jgi:hypothetical protein